MSHEFKPGDLALITNHISVPSNIGKAVELVEFLRPGERTGWIAPNGHPCVNLSPVDMWIVLGEVVGSVLHQERGFAGVSPNGLIPLRGDFSPEQQKAKEAEPCA